LVLDLDGTLLHAGLELDPAQVKALHRAIERGLTVTLATGRMPQAAAPYVAELQVTAPVILYNGALVRDPVTGGDLLSLELPPGLPWKAYQSFANAPVHPIFYRDDRLYCLELTQPIVAYCRERRLTALPVDEPQSFLQLGSFVKCLFIGHPADLRLLREELASLVGAEAHLVNSHPHHLELLPAGVSKGAALRFVARHLGVPLSRVIAVGDEENDLEMLREAGLGIAMAHAPEAVRAAADRVAPAADAGGLLALLTELCPERFV
jgi:Cof subfamily protein (haloacid dehalogenase superfamily)